jgi:hypothetical protein
MNTKLVALVFLSSLLLFGCAPSIKIVSEFSDPTYSLGQVSSGSKVRLSMAESVNVMEFKSSYEKEYRNAQQFVQVVRRQAADTMKSVLGCTVSVNDTAQDAGKIEEQLGSSSEDFFFVIKGVAISNEYSAGYMNSRTESCVVTLHAELWNTKEKKKALAYTATGRCSVTMLFFVAALKGAVEDAVCNMVKYLKTGATQ